LPVNWHLKADELAYILADADVAAVVGQAGTDDELSRALYHHGAGSLRVGADYERALEQATPLAGADSGAGPELMFYTSGTTARPKGVVHASLADDSGRVRGMEGQVALWSWTPDDVYVMSGPAYHASHLGWALCSLYIGAATVLTEQFEARSFLSEVSRRRGTRSFMVPAHFIRILEIPEDERARLDLSSFSLIVHAAAPCPVAVKRQMLEWWGPIIHEYYAGTEDIGSTWITAEEWLAHPGSVGRPTSPAHIVDGDGVELGPRHEGTVYFEGGRPFEYHNDPEKTATVTNERGWRTLGDVGFLDEDGYLYLTDRQAHMIISGGVNIYPQEAENVLAAHPAVADVAVIGVPDPEMGEQVKAVVQPVDGAAAGPALAGELIAACQAELATYKCPKTVDFVAELPRDPNGKLYKRLLRERYWEGHDSRVV
ncbi:MAG TPA: AMP-binding protein, partial [Acidimicrobiales bacterium]